MLLLTREKHDECEHNKSRGQAPGHARRALLGALRFVRICPRIEREAPRRVDGFISRTTQAAGLAWALYPADKSSSIPMGFEFEKEAVGENPQVTDEFAAAVKRG